MSIPPTLKPQDRISHYRVIGPLGAGGMGEVYRAKDETLERDVALKILPPAMVRSEERLRRFVLEAKSASSLNHPHIVTIYEIGQAEIDGTALHFISMELVTGETLATKIHGEKTDLKTLLGWLAQAAEGLAKAHAAGIVHRDLKPGNIMVSHDGYAKVLDFGLAKLTERQATDADRSSAPTMTERNTTDGVVLGTAGYMSPEQVQGKPADHRSDIFSFGCILYEAATRTQPFAAESDVETMHKILKDTPLPIEQLNAQAPAELRRLIRRCLAKDVNQRFDSMKALAIELREIVDEYDTLSASASSGSGGLPITPTRRSVAIVPLLAVVGALAVAAAVFGVWVTKRDEGRRPNAPPQSVKITPLPGHGDVGGAALSPDGRYLAYVSGPPERRGIWVRQVATGSDVEVFHGTTSPIALTFSPDGEHLFFRDPDRDAPIRTALYEIPMLGGTPPIKRATDVDSAITFAPDRKHICFSRHRPVKQEDSLIVLDLTTGQERVLSTTQPPTAMTSSPAWSPDGERIAVGESYHESGGVRYGTAVLRASDGRREVIPTDDQLRVQWLVWVPDGSGLVVSAVSVPVFHAELWLLPYPGGGGRRITNDPYGYYSLSISSDGASLAAVRVSSTLNLWTLDAHPGTGVRQLTSATAQENAVMKYTVGRDGSVVFRSRDDAHPLWRIRVDGSAPVPIATDWTLGRDWLTGIYALPDRGVILIHYDENRVRHIWRVDPDGGNPRQLTKGIGESLAGISPDGQTVLFSTPDSRPDLWAVSVHGGEPVKLVSPFVPQDQVSYSPDGTRIAYLDETMLDGKPQSPWRVISAVDGRSIASIPLDANDVHGAAFPDLEWTGDGTALTYLDKVDGIANVYRQPLDGGQPERLTRFTEGQIRDHEWSPDGRAILLIRGDGRINNLWMTAADGSHAVPLTDFKTGRIDGADWLPPDGRQIVFTYGQQTNDVVLVKNFR